MRPDEYVLASHAIHLEMGRLAERLQELVRFRCAEPTNQVFQNIMNRQHELLEALSELHDQTVTDYRQPHSLRWPLHPRTAN